jgi:glycerophosphoryl diester phosphodiesterase
MTTEQYRKLAAERGASSHFEHRGLRALFAAATSIGLVLIFILNPDAAMSYASSVNLFGALRAPGEPAFIAGHRGDRAHFPENTLPALQAVLDSDFDFVETDVQLSADGVPVLMHDETVERTTNGAGLVSSLTAAQLASLDAGSWYSSDFAYTPVPTLDQFLEIFQHSTKRAMLELKGIWTPEQVAIVTSLVYARGVQNRVIFEAFDFETLESLCEAAPFFKRVIIQRYLPSDPVELVNRFGAIAILTSASSLERNPQAVEQLHEAGLFIVLYTLNGEATWTASLALGVDGIITDKPSKLDRWIAENAPGT